MKQDITIETKVALTIEDKMKFPKIRGHKHLTNANAAMKGLKALKDEVKAVFDPIVQKTRAAWKEALRKKDEILKPIEAAEYHIKSRIGEYLDEQDKLRRAAEEKERLRLEAERLEAKGKEEAAEQIQEQVDEIPTTKPAASYIPPQLEGTHIREDWDYEITSMSIFLNKAPRAFLLPNHMALRKYVKANKGQDEIPGVRAFMKKTVVNR